MTASKAKTRKVKKAGGRPRAEELSDRIGHVLDVAETLIVREGYQAISVDAIARAAQISKKTIYSQFDNKAGLLAAVVDRLARSRSVALSHDHRQPLREGLLHCASVILDASYDETTIRFDIVLFREGRMFPELGQTFERAAREQYIKPVADYLATCAKRGLLRDIEPTFVAEAFVHLLTADIIIKTAMGEAAKRSPAQRRAHAERVCDLVIEGVSSRAGRTRSIA